MFHLSSLFQRGRPRPPLQSVPSAPVDEDLGPRDHVVLKDGRPFAILNATPALARRTLDNFVRSTPEARWTLARC
ncbi:MAG: hypothetical protein AB1918_04250 [Pseudomonadota bacterium]